MERSELLLRRREVGWKGTIVNHTHRYRGIRLFGLWWSVSARYVIIRSSESALHAAFRQAERDRIYRQA